MDIFGRSQEQGDLLFLCPKSQYFQGLSAIRRGIFLKSKIFVDFILTTAGPRPALWNQDLLTAERDKYGANDVKPGLTGWAQINGRDELEIPEKAQFDGVYAEKMSFKLDCKCFFGSVHVFKEDDSVVEGGTGEMKKQEEKEIANK